MRVFVLLTVMGLTLALEQGVFQCDTDSMLAPGAGNVTISNQVHPHFTFDLQDEHTSMVSKYSAYKPITVTLKVYPVNATHRISAFMLQARAPATSTPVGEWQMVTIPFHRISCGGHTNNVLFLTEGFPMKNVTFSYTPPASNSMLELVATVVTVDDNIYTNISSVELNPTQVHVDTPVMPSEHHKEEEQEEKDLHDPHADTREWEEKSVNPDLEELPGRILEEEEVEEEGPYEDANEGELVEEEEKKHSEFMDDHGLRDEEEASIKRQEEEARNLQQELTEGEGDWMKEEIDLKRQEEEDRHMEMMEYERITSEEEKRRIELIEWEIKDKEEHDRLMAEKEKEKNQTPKEDKPDTEVEIHEEIIVIKEEVKAAGGAATLTAGLTLLLASVVHLF